MSTAVCRYLEGRPSGRPRSVSEPVTETAEAIEHAKRKPTMSNSCVKHPMTFGTQICGECGHHFCEECVVFPFGVKKPPVCISCALELGGISSRPSGRPKLSRQSIRERRAAQRKAQKATHAEQVSSSSGGSTDGSSDGQTGVYIESADDALPVAAPDWIEDSESIETVPGGWSQTFR